MLRLRLSHRQLEVGELSTVAFNDWAQQPRRWGYTHSSRIQRVFFLYPDPMWVLWGMSFDLSFVGLCWNLMMESTIWGLSKQGKTCKACGLCVHTKCELKVKISIRVPSRPEPGSRFRRTAQKAYLLSLLSPVRPRHHPASARPVRANGMLIFLLESYVNCSSFPYNTKSVILWFATSSTGRKSPYGHSPLWLHTFFRVWIGRSR